MTDIQRDMQNIRSHSQHGQEQSTQTSGQVQSETLSSPEAETMTKLRPLLEEIAASFLAGDSQLTRKSPMADGLGFTIVTSDKQRWLAKAFYVTVTLKGFNIEIVVADGQWEQVPQFLGNWADWTDQKTVFQGPFDANRIRVVLEKAFLSWYQHVYPVQ